MVVNISRTKFKDNPSQYFKGKLSCNSTLVLKYDSCYFYQLKIRNTTRCVAYTKLFRRWSNFRYIFIYYNILLISWTSIAATTRNYGCLWVGHPIGGLLQNSVHNTVEWSYMRYDTQVRICSPCKEYIFWGYFRRLVSWCLVDEALPVLASIAFVITSFNVIF